MPFSDGSSGVIEKVLLPFDDLNLKEGTVGFLRTPEDVAVHLAVLSAQGPQGAKLLRATSQGHLKVDTGTRLDTVLALIPPATYALPWIGPTLQGPYADSFLIQWAVTAVNGSNPQYGFVLEGSLDGGTTWEFYKRLVLTTGVNDEMDLFYTTPIPPLFRMHIYTYGDATSLTGFLYMAVSS